MPSNTNSNIIDLQTIISSISKKIKYVETCSESQAHTLLQTTLLDTDKSRLQTLCSSLSKQIIVLVLDFAQRQKSGSNSIKYPSQNSINEIGQVSKALFDTVMAFPMTMGKYLIIQLLKDAKNLFEQLRAIIAVLHSSPSSSQLNLVQSAGLLRATCETFPSKYSCNAAVIKSRIDALLDEFTDLNDALECLSRGGESNNSEEDDFEDDFDEVFGDNLDGEEADEELLKHRCKNLLSLKKTVSSFEYRLRSLQSLLPSFITLGTGKVTASLNEKLDSVIQKTSDLFIVLRDFSELEYFEFKSAESVPLDDFPKEEQIIGAKLKEWDALIFQLEAFGSEGEMTTSLADLSLSR